MVRVDCIQVVLFTHTVTHAEDLSLANSGLSENIVAKVTLETCIRLPGLL